MTKTQTPTNGTEESVKPVFSYHIGVVAGAVWLNEHGNDAFYDSTFNRLYKEGDSREWGRSHSFGRDDLLALAKVVDVCHSWIIREQQKQSAS